MQTGEITWDKDAVVIQGTAEADGTGIGDPIVVDVAADELLGRLRRRIVHVIGVFIPERRVGVKRGHASFLLTVLFFGVQAENNGRATGHERLRWHARMAGGIDRARFDSLPTA